MPRERNVPEYVSSLTAGRFFFDIGVESPAAALVLSGDRTGEPAIKQF